MAFGVKSTRREAAPVRMIVHGPPGVGKSTFVASAPSAIFIAAEDGLEEIDAEAVYPYPKTYEDVLGALDHVVTLKNETVALDSLDWLEPLVWEYTVRKANSSKIKSIEDFGYGKGYVAALDHWRVLIRRLEVLRVQGKHVVLIAHSKRATVKNPIGDDYEQWSLKLHEKATGLFVEWSRIIGYLDLDLSTEDTSGRVKALTTGKRILRTVPNPACLAKSRTERPLPDRILVPRRRGWETFAAALAAASETDEATVIRLRTDLEERIKTVADPDIETKARAFVSTNGGTASAIAEAIATLDSYLAERKAS